MEKTKSYKNLCCLNIDVEQSAEGIIDVVNSNMIRAIKFVSVQGYDPRNLPLWHWRSRRTSCKGKLAEDRNSKIIVPYSPGTFCALGLVLSDIKCDCVHSRLLTKEQINTDILNEIYQDLDKQGDEELEKQDVPVENRVLIRTCDMRYFGQAFEISVPLPSKVMEVQDIEDMIDKFHNLHEQAYGHCMREEPIEFVNYRVSAIGTFPKPDLINSKSSKKSR